MMITLAVWLFAAAAAAEPAPLPPARFCAGAPGSDLMAGRCVDVAADEIDAGPSDKARDWLWIDSARKSIVLGSLAAGESKVKIEEKPSALFTIRGSSERGWPAATSVTLFRGKQRWKFTIPRENIVKLGALCVADGTYDLLFEAPRHLSVQLRGKALSHAKPAQLGSVELKPVPMLLGKFVNAKGEPLADVAVNTPEGTALATSDGAGFVHEELRGALPPRLFIRREGYGHRSAEVTRKEADFDLGTVTLSPGSTLTINVDRGGYTGPITATLIRPGEHTIGKRTTYETVTVKPDVSRIELRDVEAREYVLILRGEQPMQILRDGVTVAEHENATKDIRLGSHSVKAFVHKGSAPLAETKVDLTGPNGEWSSTIKTDSEGHFTTDAWLEGYVGASIVFTPETRYFAEQRVGKSDTEWDIEVTDRTMRGIIVDKATNAPIPLVDASLRTVKLLKGSGTGLRSVKVDDGGRFTLEMLEAGQYEVSARGAGYLNAKVPFEIAPDDRDREIRVEMEHGRDVVVKVVNSDGSAAAGAIIIGPRVSPAEPPQVATADASGSATLIFRGDETLAVWAMSTAGSFQPATIDPNNKPEQNRIVLPAPNASVTIRAAHEDGSPAAHTHLFLAYNGNLLPDDVRFAFGREHFLTGSDGINVLTLPAGEYDFWSWETPEELVTYIPSQVQKPTHASILPGGNSVNLVVIPRAVGKK